MPRPKAQPSGAATDAELLAGCRMGDEQAVRALTTRYNRRLYRMARGILRHDAEAEDVVQETYVRAFTKLEGFRGDASFSTWLTRIAMNDAIGRLRRRRPSVEWNPAAELEHRARIIHFPSPSSGADPEAALATHEIRAFLERAIDDLPDAYRAAFIARVVEGMTIAETADILGVRPETVKTRVHRARRRLRDAVDRRLGPVLAGAFPFDGARCGAVTDAVVRRLRFGPAFVVASDLQRGP